MNAAPVTEASVTPNGAWQNIQSRRARYMMQRREAKRKKRLNLCALVHLSDPSFNPIIYSIFFPHLPSLSYYAVALVGDG